MVLHLDATARAYKKGLTMPNPVAFIHTPKCGGTSIGSALRARYFLSQATINLKESRSLQALLYPDAAGVARIGHEFDVRDVMLAQLVGRKVCCISAHTRYHPGIRRTDPLNRKYITVLREPISRFISHLHYVKRRHPESLEGESVDAFLDSDQAFRFGSEYLFYFARSHQLGHPDVNHLIDTACKNLTTFDVVGDTTRMPYFRSKVERELGVRLLPLKRNRRPSGAMPSFSDAQLTRIRQICEPDLAVYEFARNNLIV
ncbi:MAG: hypothetical protein AAGA12_14620 [Pseudomonadota bacterium]